MFTVCICVCVNVQPAQPDVLQSQSLLLSFLRCCSWYSLESSQGRGPRMFFHSSKFISFSLCRAKNPQEAELNPKMPWMEKQTKNIKEDHLPPSHPMLTSSSVTQTLLLPYWAPYLTFLSNTSTILKPSQRCLQATQSELPLWCTNFQSCPYQIFTFCISSSATPPACLVLSVPLSPNHTSQQVSLSCQSFL